MCRRSIEIGHQLHLAALSLTNHSTLSASAFPIGLRWMSCSSIIQAAGLRGCIGVTLYVQPPVNVPYSASHRPVTPNPDGPNLERSRPTMGNGREGAKGAARVPVPGVVPPTARNLHGVDYPTKERRSTARLTQLLTQIPAVEPSTRGLMTSGSFRRANGKIQASVAWSGGEATNFSLPPMVVRTLSAPSLAASKC